MDLKKYKKIYHLILIFLLIPVIVFSQEKKKKDDTFKRATKYFFQKKFSMAEILFQQELKKNPENHKAYSYLGDIFLKKKRYDGALNLYQKALDLKPDSGENYFRVGQAHYYKKNSVAAIENFQKAYELDKSLTFAHYHIGLVYLMLVRDKQNTIESWEKYLALTPEDPQYGKLKRVIEILKNPDFKLPPVGSKVSIEEALHLGGAVLKKKDPKTIDRSAGHMKMKTKVKVEDIIDDDEDL